MTAEIYLQWGKPVRKTSTPILYPVEVFAVLAPNTRHHINVFQEAVLGLLATGLHDLSELAESLNLDRQLVAFIIAQELQPRGWVDANQRVTPEGMTALKGEAPTSSLTVMYAFKDAISGRWLPRFARSLEEINPTPNSSPDWPEFVENRGTGNVRRPHVLRHRSQIQSVDLVSLQSAWKDFRRDIRKAALDDEEWLDLTDNFLELLDDAPKKAWVMCEVYAAPQDLHPWLVSDPWRVTPALRVLREALQLGLGADKPLAQKIIRLLRPDEDKLDREAPADRLAQLDLLAKARVAQEAPKLTGPEHQLMQEYFLRVIRLQESISATTKPYQEELASLANQCGSLLEATLKWMLDKWRVDTKGWPPSWQRKELQSLLQSLPLMKPLTRASLDALSGQAANQVKYAGRDKDRPFKALMVAALLSTHVHPDHPLRAISDSGLDWSLMDLRNESSHASNQRLNKGEVLQLTGSALDWFRQFEIYL